MPVRFERFPMRVLVLGAGYAGVALTRKLERTLDDFYRSLSADVETISEPQTTETGTKICFLRDPDDHLVEVLELAD